MKTVASRNRIFAQVAWPLATARFTMAPARALGGCGLGASHIRSNRDGIFLGPQSGKDFARDMLVLSVPKSL